MPVLIMCCQRGQTFQRLILSRCCCFSCSTAALLRSSSSSVSTFPPPSNFSALATAPSLSICNSARNSLNHTHVDSTNSGYLIEYRPTRDVKYKKWLSGLMCFLSHSTCWVLVADDLGSNPGRGVFSVSWANGRYAMRLISRTYPDVPPVSCLNCDRCRL